MLLLKERYIVNRLYQCIWREKHPRGEEYKYKRDGGVPFKDFLDWLGKKELWPSNSKLRNLILSIEFFIRKIFNKEFFLDSYYKNEEIIKRCLNDKYIKKDTAEAFPLTETTLLSITGKADRLRERITFIEIFLKENSKISVFILGIAGTLLVQFLLNYFNLI